MTPIWLLLLYVPGLVALYFLKLKRRDVVISSTILWRRSLEDLHVNAPFQRLRKNWLLLLQLLVLSTLIVAAWRPRMTGEAAGGRNVLLLIDNSASMSAREAEGTRLDLAKRDALALVSKMTGSDRVGLIVFASGTAVLEPLTSDSGLLEARIKSVEPTTLPSRLDQALVVAHGIAQSVAGAEVHVFGDGCYGDLSALPPEVKRMQVKLSSVGTSLPNLGVTEIDVRRSFEAKGRTEVFALIESFDPAPARVAVTLKVEGVTRDARELEIAPGGSQAVVFDASSVEEGMAEVSIDAPDALDSDNRAWVRISPRKPIRALSVGKANPWIDLVMQSANGVQHRRMGEAEFARATQGVRREAALSKLGADVVLFDRASPEAFGPDPAGGAETRKNLPEPILPSIYIACRPPLPAAARAEDDKEKPVVIDWDRAHPLNRFIVLTDLFIETSTVFQPSGDLRSVVDCDSGSLVATCRYYHPGERPVPAVLLGFDILKTNWPIGHYSFPIFFSNALEWLSSGGASLDATHVRAGEALVFEPTSASEDTRVRFKSPSGRHLNAVREATGAFTVASANETGVYEVEVDGATAGRIAVGLLSARESDLVPTKALDFGEFKVDVSTAREKGARDLWKWFAAGALLICVLEWLVYNRRLAG